MKKIAILGATGVLGQPVTRAFMQAGSEVTALVRHTAKAKNVFGPNIRFIHGDLNDLNSIDKLLEGQETLYLNLSVRPESSVKQFLKMPFGLVKFFGKLTNTYDCGAKIIKALNHYPEKFEAEKTWRDLGKPSTRFMDYISVPPDPE